MIKNLNLVRKIKTQDKTTLLILLLILLLGALLRLYRIDEYMTFLGDEGRDMLVVKRIVKDGRFTLLGPITSVGSMYMGPVYYYMIAPFLLLFNFHPVGPAVMVAIFSLSTIFLIYFTVAKYFGGFAGLTSSFFYSIAPLTIVYGRSSWNPNVVPFFSMWYILAILIIFVERRFFFLAVVGAAFGILIQLHYVTLILVPVFIAVLLYDKLSIPLGKIILGFFGFLLTFSPFLLFEIRHQFVNSRALWRFAFGEGRGVTLSFFSYVKTVNDVLVRIFWRLLVVENAEVTKLFIVFLLVSLYFFKKSIESKKKKKAFNVIALWLVVSILSFGFYQGVIYDYYLGSLFPVPFILAGISISYLYKSKTAVFKLLSIAVVLALSYFMLVNSPLNIPPSNLYGNTKEIARFVFEKTQGLPYNFALIASGNSDHAYRYFLELWGHPPTVIEPETVDPERESVTDQLLVVCEEKVCQPLGHPLWEIAGFGRAEISGRWKVRTAEVFRLIHFRNKSIKNLD